MVPSLITVASMSQKSETFTFIILIFVLALSPASSAASFIACEISRLLSRVVLLNRMNAVKSTVIINAVEIVAAIYLS